MNFQEKCRLVHRAKPGDKWVNTKTGRMAEILLVKDHSVKIRHESGRVTYKGDHYSAGDFDPVTSESPQGTQIGALVMTAINNITPQELALGYLRFERFMSLGPKRQIDEINNYGTGLAESIDIMLLSKQSDE